jgi:hypothetical protein
MARIENPSKKQKAQWRKWVAERPRKVRKVAERFDPWSLYRMKSTGQRVTIRGFYEDGTLSVTVSGRFNLTLFERYVFGIDPADLEPCDLPGPTEAVGAMLTDGEVEYNIDALRCAARPDLWEMGDDGVAIRKVQ